MRNQLPGQNRSRDETYQPRPGSAMRSQLPLQDIGDEVREYPPYTPEAVDSGLTEAEASALYEPALGNPPADGYTLTSTAGGTRSWQAGGSVWGGISGTLADQTDLNSALAAKVADADVRGGATSLNARLGCISNFASPNAGGVVVGQYYDNSFQGTASATLAGAANRIDLAPYYTSVPLAIDRIGVAVSTDVASALAKVVIYSSDSSGWPDALLYESGNLDCSTTGMKEEALTFTFSSGVQYWVGVRHSSTATLRTINVSSAVNLGLTSSSASNYATILRRTVTFANAAPNPWTFTNTDRVANVTPPSIRFRAA